MTPPTMAPVRPFPLAPLLLLLVSVLCPLTAVDSVPGVELSVDAGVPSDEVDPDTVPGSDCPVDDAVLELVVSVAPIPTAVEALDTGDPVAIDDDIVWGTLRVLLGGEQGPLEQLLTS